MARMTEEEAWEADEFFTQNTIMPDSGKPGFFARKKCMLVAVDSLTAAYLRSVCETTHKEPAQIISELVRGEIAREADPVCS
jgi:hypothetical protein